MNYAIADSANFRLKEKATSNIVLYTPYANQTNMEFTTEQVYAMAKGSRAVRFDYSKQGQLVCELEVFDLKWISIILGGAWSTGSVDNAKREVLTVSASNTATLAATPTVGSLAVFKLKADNISHDTEQTAGTPATNPDEYSIATDTITFSSASCPEGTKVVVYYLIASAITAETIEIKSSEFPVSYEIIGDTMMARKHDGVTEYVQFTCPNAKPLGNLTLSMNATGSVTNLSATFDLFPDENDNMVVITKL